MIEQKAHNDMSILLLGQLAVITILLPFLFVISNIQLQKQVQPMLVLTAIASRIRAGEEGVRADVTTQDEIGQLTSAFNDMLDTLHEKEQALQFLTNELEIRVADRTAALTDSNDQLLAEINERIQAEAEKAHSESLFRNVITSISDHIYVAKIEANHWANIYYSPNVESLTGYPHEKFMADGEFWVSQVIHPDDKAKAIAQAEKFAKNENSEAEYRLKRKDGRVIWVRDSGRIEADEDSADTMIIYGVISDITERKEIQIALDEEQSSFVQLVDTANAPIFGIDAQGMVNEWNQTAERITGFSKDDVLGQDLVAKFITDEYKTAVKEVLDNALHGKETANYEFPLYTKSGERVLVLLNATTRRLADGEIIGVIGVGQDITELDKNRSLLEQRVNERTTDLSRANAELAKTARMKDEFLASMSHELRTPLNSVLGMSEMLRENIYGELNQKQLQAVDQIEESGEHLLSLINDILDLSKIESGKFELEIESVSVEDVCQASVRMVKQLAQKKRIKIFSDVEDNAVTIRADSRRLKQMLVNLLSNAVKFTPEKGRVSLEVSLDETQEVMTFVVWDTGIGIAEEDLTKLFQPFVQLDSKLSRQYEGTGLGLALISRLVEMHNGSLAVESEIGRGSQFTISLPWYSVDGSAEPIEEHDLSSLNNDVQQALIIEDSPTSAEQISRYLTEMKINTVIYSKGEGAVDKIRELLPDVIILDINLGNDISGWDILEHLKSTPQTQEIPVVIVSALTERTRGLRLGAAEYLVKPTSRQELWQVLSNMVRHEDESSETKALVVTTTLESATKLDKPLILLAEDNEANIASMLDFLIANDYRVIIARNGAEAVSRATEEQPDIILMDIQMPVMDGIEAIKHIRGNSKLVNIPIIALTALAMPGDRERCLNAGANEYMSKPIKLKLLVEMIGKAIMNYEL